MVGIPSEVGPWLESRLPGVKAESASLDEELADLVQRGDYALLLLDHGMSAPFGYSFLEAAARSGQTLPPVFYSLPSLEDFGLLYHLVHELKVQRLLVDPLVPEELLERLSEALGVPRAVPSRPIRARRPSLSPTMEKLWSNHLPGLKEKARRIAQAGALEEATERSEVQRCAHQLAGTVGTFGLPTVTELARQAEAMLITGGADADRARLRQLGAEILTALEEAGEPAGSMAPAHPPAASTWEDRLRLAERAVLTLTHHGSLSEQGLQEVREEIQRLRTAAGIFRWTSIAQSAGEVEKILSTPGLGSASAAALAERVRHLRLEIERSGIGQVDRAGQTVLLSDLPDPRWKDLELALQLYGYSCCRLSPEQMLRTGQGQAAVLEFDPVSRDLAFRIVESLQSRAVPCLVYADRADLVDKVRLTSLGVRALLESATPAAEVLALVREALEAPREPRGRILVMDDDRVILKVVERMLTTAGFQVVVEQEPLLFWERLREFAPDLVLLDVDMPRLSGIELCRVLRQDAYWGGLPAIFLTVERDPEMVERMFAAGADDYVLKPFVGGELLRRIELRLTRFQRGWQAILSGRQSDRRASMLRLEWFLQLSNRLRQPLTLVQVEEPETFLPGQDLSAVEQHLREACLPGDVVLRWGGQALIWVLVATGRADAQDRIEAALPLPVRLATASFPRDGVQVDRLIDCLQRGIDQTHSSSGYRQGMVALVDDDPTVLDMVRETLEPHGMAIRSFTSCAEARRALLVDNLGPRVILLDVNLPDGNGYDLLAELVEAGLLGQSRVIMLTGETTSFQRVFQAIERGAFDYISKPFHPWTLSARVRRAWTNPNPAGVVTPPAVGE